jgi:hypothetical protein
LLLLLISVHPYIIGPCAWWLIIKWQNNNVSAAFGSVGIVASFADNPNI